MEQVITPTPGLDELIAQLERMAKLNGVRSTVLNYAASLAEEERTEGHAIKHRVNPKE